MTADEFRIALVRLHLSQKAFSEETGLHLTTISRYAQGHLEIPKLVAGYLELAIEACSPAAQQGSAAAKQQPAVVRQGRWWE